MDSIVEFRSYTLKPGSGDAFDRLMREQALPMLQRWNVDVVACTRSLHDPDAYCLIRAYRDVAHRNASQDAFYGSPEWLQGPREAILALIESHTSVLLPLDPATIDAFRPLAIAPG